MQEPLSSLILTLTLTRFLFVQEGFLVYQLSMALENYFNVPFIQTSKLNEPEQDAGAVSDLTSLPVPLLVLLPLTVTMTLIIALALTSI